MFGVLMLSSKIISFYRLVHWSTILTVGSICLTLHVHVKIFISFQCLLEQLDLLVRFDLAAFSLCPALSISIVCVQPD